MARATDVGSRTFVWAALAGKDVGGEVHGRYTASCRVEEESDYVLSKEGGEVEERVWVSRICLSLIFLSQFVNGLTERGDCSPEQGRP